MVGWRSGTMGSIAASHCFTLSVWISEVLGVWSALASSFHVVKKGQ